MPVTSLGRGFLSQLLGFTKTSTLFPSKLVSRKSCASRPNCRSSAGESTPTKWTKRRLLAVRETVMVSPSITLATFPSTGDHHVLSLLGSPHGSSEKSSFNFKGGASSVEGGFAGGSCGVWALGLTIDTHSIRPANRM